MSEKQSARIRRRWLKMEKRCRHRRESASEAEFGLLGATFPRLHLRFDSFADRSSHLWAQERPKVAGTLFMDRSPRKISFCRHNISLSVRRSDLAVMRYEGIVTWKPLLLSFLVSNKYYTTWMQHGKTESRLRRMSSPEN